MAVLCLIAPVAMGAQYIVVLNAGREPEPDLVALGAVQELRWRDRLQLRIADETALAALAAHPRVAFVQEVLAPGVQPAGDATLAASDAPIAAHSAPSSWQSGDYGFDGAGDVIRVGDNDYLYDALGRIVQADVHSGGAVTTDKYRYDAYGNLHRRETNGPSGTSVLSTPVSWETNRLDGATYTGGGDVETRPGSSHTYDWDALHMMSALTAPGRADTFVYSPSDDRIAVRSGGVWKWSFRNMSGKVVRRYESTDGGPWLWIEDVVHREGVIAGTERPSAQGGRRHFHLDHLGSARFITDHAGRGVSQHDFLPFGIELTSIRQEQDRGYAAENTFRFTGHERDFVGGTLTENTDYIDYMRARYYVPATARFLSIDPGGMDAKQPQSWNRYSYVQGNPVTRFDPDGRDWRDFLDLVRTKAINAYEHLKKADAHFSNVLIAKIGPRIEPKKGLNLGPVKVKAEIAPRIDEDGTVTVTPRVRATVEAGGRENGPRGGVQFTVWKDGGPTFSAELKGEVVSRGDDGTAKASASGEFTGSITLFGFINVEAGVNVIEATQGLSELNLGLTELANDWFSIKQQDELEPPEDEEDDWLGGPWNTGKGN